MKNFTDITVLLDRSGSMTSIKKAMESGIREFIKGHQVNPDTRLTVIQFDDTNSQEVVVNNQPIGNVNSVSIEPRGMTPLNDALCNAIDNTGLRLSRMLELDRPNKVLFVIITDGMENASRLYKKADVRRRIETQNGVYNWQFTYLGANQDAFKEAEDYGIFLDHAINFAAASKGVGSTFRSLVSNTVAYSNTGDSGHLNYTKSQRKGAMETDDKQ